MLSIRDQMMAEMIATKTAEKMGPIIADVLFQRDHAAWRAQNAAALASRSAGAAQVDPSAE